MGLLGKLPPICGVVSEVIHPAQNQGESLPWAGPAGREPLTGTRYLVQVSWVFGCRVCLVVRSIDVSGLVALDVCGLSALVRTLRQPGPGSSSAWRGTQPDNTTSINPCYCVDTLHAREHRSTRETDRD